jgi:hypothetical protein
MKSATPDARAAHLNFYTPPAYRAHGGELPRGRRS